MSIKNKAIGWGKNVLSAIGVVVIGVLITTAIASFAPQPALWIAAGLGIFAAAAWLMPKRLPIPNPRLWGALAAFLAFGMSSVASNSLSRAGNEALEALRDKDPTSYLQQIKKSGSDAEYLAELKVLDPAAYAKEQEYRAAEREQTRLAAEKEQERRAAEEAANSPEARATKARAAYVEQLHRELQGLGDYDPTKYSGSRDDVTLAIAMHGAWVKIYKNGADLGLSADELALQQKYKAEIVKAQKRAFPVYRKAMGKALDEALWESDVDVSTFGARSTTIQFVGSYFAANRNIKSTQTTLDALLQHLRYKRAQYRWYKEADKFTYYDIDGLDDGDFAEVTDFGWVKLAD